MRAQGEQYLQQAEIGEQRRLQQIQISEGQRTQQADAAGRSFMFNAQERRKDAQINFTRGQITGQTQRAQQAYDQGTRSVWELIVVSAASKGVVLLLGGRCSYIFDSEMQQLVKHVKNKDAAALKYR